MGYITEDYYRQVYCGNDVDGIDVLIERASDIIDNVTMMRIGGEEGLGLPPVVDEPEAAHELRHAGLHVRLQQRDDLHLGELGVPPDDRVEDPLELLLSPRVQPQVLLLLEADALPASPCHTPL